MQNQSIEQLEPGKQKQMENAIQSLEKASVSSPQRERQETVTRLPLGIE